MNNQLLAKIIFSNKLATKEQIHAHWSELTKSKDIALVLIEQGVLKAYLYEQLIQYMAKLEAKKQNSQDKPNVSANSLSEIDSDSKTPIQTDASSKNPTETSVYSAPKNKKAEVASLLSGNSLYGTATVKSVKNATGIVSANPYGSITIDPRSIEKETELEQTLIGNITVSTPKEVSNQQSEKFEQVSLADQKKSSSPTKIKSASEDSSMSEGSLPNTFVGNRGEGSLGFEPITDYALTSSLDQLLHLCRVDDASDLHLSTGSPIVIRKYRSLRSFGEILTNVHIETFISYLSPLDQKQLKDNGDHELIYTIAGSGRCRMTLMKHRAGYDITSRIIANSIRPFNESGLPDHCKSLTKWAQGLVLLTGPVGCGKTTTLSTLVDLVNQERKDHIISIESPVEIVYPNGNCQMTQREVGTHTMSQANALKGALRQDPDILVVSELRDLESIELAVSAAETGHLVFATMNTTNAMRTISRLIDSFPLEKRDIVRAMVSESLRGVISQQLIPKKSGDGVVVAYEVLMVTAPVSNMIRKDELHQLESAMMTGKSQGMILLDDSLQQLVDSETIAGDEAFYRANNSKRFESYVS